MHIHVLLLFPSGCKFFFLAKHSFRVLDGAERLSLIRDHDYPLPPFLLNLQGLNNVASSESGNIVLDLYTYSEITYKIIFTILQFLYISRFQSSSLN